MAAPRTDLKARKKVRAPGARPGARQAPAAKPAAPPASTSRAESAARAESPEKRSRPRIPPPPPKPKPKPVKPEGPRRAGSVAIVGRPNVGKSTILNAALDQRLSIVSPTPQTTRDAILGVVHLGNAEIALLDTPGLHRARSELGRVMNQTAREAARVADVVVFVAEVPLAPARKPADGSSRLLDPHPGDLTLLADIAAGRPTVLVLNKVDRAKDKTVLFPLIEAYTKIRPFAAVVPISALKPDATRRVLEEVAALLPEAAWHYEADMLTDRPVRFFAAEYVREQILHATQAEVPHAVAITVDRFVEPMEGDGGSVHIDATICVERPGQKRILIGTGGDMLKVIGTKARMRIQELTGRKVNLKLWVRVTPAWRQSREQLDELGYRAQPGGGETVAMIEMEDPEDGSATQAPDLDDEVDAPGEVEQEEDEEDTQ